MRYKQSENIVTRKAVGELLLIPVKGNMADMQHLFTLNEVGAEIWECLSVLTTEGPIVQHIVDLFRVDYDTAKSDVREMLRVMSEKNLVVKEE